jgi:uncharacterized delta-60 repeat protein
VAALVLSLVLGVFPNALAATKPLDGFNPNANGIVTAVVIQPDGKILMGGYFTQVAPVGGSASGSSHLARVNHDGTVDTSFSPSTNDVVRALVLQPNGQIIVAGNFTAVQGTGSSSQVTRNYLARLNADGSLDATFNPNANGIVYAVAYQPNGQIVIGGSFTSIQANGAATATTRNYIARLNADGSLDATFNPDADRPVLAAAVEPSGQIVIGGGFSKLQPNGASVSTARLCAARLNSDGSLDTTFDPEPNGSVDTILVLPSGQIVIGGEFVTVQPNGAANPSQADFLARLNADGTLDGNFIINPLSTVNALALQSDGRLIIGGSFTSVYPETALSADSISYVVRVNPDGTLDSSFIPQPNQAVNAIAVQADGDVVLGGYFTALYPLDSATGITRNHIARVSDFGVPDATLDPDSTGTVYASASQSNGQTLIGGTFLSVGGVTQSYMARLNANGSVDTTFEPAFNGPVQAIVVQPNGEIIVGGSFSEVDGFVRNYIVRLNPDGTIDGAFNPNPNANITTLALQSDGKILISGGFGELTPNGSPSGYAVNNFARLNADGSLDTTFNPSPSGGVFAIAIQSDGRIVVGGGFTSIGGVTRGYVARLLPSGAIDTAAFDPEANEPVYAMAIQSDGKVLIGGSFTGVIPQTGKTGTPTTTTTPYGTVTLPAAGTNATTPIYVNHLARLNTDGTLDTSFYPDPSADVLALAVQPDGKILVGGTYTSFAQNGATTGITRNYVARVNTDGSLDGGFNPNANDLVNATTLLSNGDVLITGAFTTLQPNGAASPIFANHVAILNTDGSLDSAFTAGATPGANGQVNAIIVQPNGQFIFGGSFSPLGGTPGSNLGRFNADSTPDTTYNASVDGPVNTIAVEPQGAATQTPSNSGVWLEPNGAVRHSYSASTDGEVVCTAQQADGKIIVGGLFNSFGGDTNTQNLVRLNADGTVDTTFAPTPNGIVSAIIIQPDGKIVIGGGFTTVDAVDNQYLARLNTDGTIDNTFAPQPNLQVLALALAPNGQILAGGDFSQLTPTGATTTAAFNFMARVNTDGTIDKTFNPDFNSPVYAIQVLASGKILVGGSFTTETPGANTTTYDAAYLVRLNTDATVDTSFYPEPNGPISALAVETSGTFIVGGSFSQFQQNLNVTGQTVGAVMPVLYLARVKTDGTIDSTFRPTPNSAVTFVALQPNGQVLVAGAFSTLQPNSTGFPANRYHIGRVNADGTLDPSFDPGLNGTVDTIEVLSDGSLFVGGNFTAVQVGGAVLIGGSFNTIQANLAPNLGRLNSDGTFDSSYIAHPNGPVNVITPRSDGMTLVGGNFSSVDGVTVSNLVRLSINGGIDTTFSSSPNGAVYAAALEQDGEIVIGGSFTSVSGGGPAHLARLEPSGAPESTFAPSINGTVSAVVVQPNGQIVVGGSFTSVDGVTLANLARINADGTVDATFAPNPNGAVHGVSLQVDGTFYVSGAFTTIGGDPLPNAAHLAASGAVDTAFTPAPNGPVNAIAVQEDGKLMIGGAFNQAGGLARLDLARFAATDLVTETFGASTDESTLTWTRTGGAPIFSNVLFEESTDGANWKTVGVGSSTDGQTWEITGVSPTGATTFYVRTTGIVPSSQFGSSGLLQSLFLANTLGTPVVSSAPVTSGTSGSSFSYTVTASGTPKTFTASGLPAGLSINSATGVISGTPVASGTYSVVVTVGNGSGTTVSALTISIAASSTRFSPASTSAANRLLNLSSRAQLSGNNVLIAGFVVTGTGPKSLLLRAVGPGLAPFGLSNVMATPELQVYSSDGTLMNQNAAWGGSSALASLFGQVGAFGLPAGSSDAALQLSLPPGSYTMHVFDPSGRGGIVLAEIYDASSTPLTSPTRLINISTRGTVSPGAGALIGGFVINGNSTKSVLIRGIGPGLSAFSVNDAIADPVLSVFDANGNIVAQNFAWSNQDIVGSEQATITAQDITTNGTSVGAFALSATSADTALIANLPPGSYTFQVTSAGNGTGEALGEVYELP